MQKSNIPIIILVFVVLACNNSTSTKDAKKDSAVVKQPVDSIALQMTGIYGGYVPCPDCPGIQTYLSLNSDKKFRLEETYTGKDKIEITEGSWTRENDKILLYQGDNLKLSFLHEPGKVMQLDPSGNRIAGNLGDKFVLTLQEMAHNTAWDEKKKAGIDFIGVGNEPFWGLDIDKDNKVILRLADLKSPIIFPYNAPLNSGGSKEYHVEGNGNSLDITITPQFCSDGMSEFLYDHKVTLKYNGKEYAGCGVTLTSL